MALVPETTTPTAPPPVTARDKGLQLYEAGELAHHFNVPI
jgi:hypothetical protein